MGSPEILAPAGSMEALTAALRTGANAVYVGGKRFSARSSAANFSVEELEQAAYQCHIHGALLYLAVNTVISDSEAAEFCEYIKKAAKAGVDAFIVQDHGAAEIIRGAVPDAVLHASTQMSIHTAAGARYLADSGYERVVPARELSADTLKKICAEDIEVEVFVHGALCMSVSGQCYMSAMIGSRSANRGCCGQACRLPFSAAGNRDAAALSLKDLSLFEHTDKLREIGVDSLKIEGRMKRPEYIAASVTELKKALGGSSPDMKLLRGVFSRGGFTNGYFTGKRQDMFGVREKEDVIAAKDIFPKLHELYRREASAHKAALHVVMKIGQPLKITGTVGDISAEVTGNIPDTAKNAPTDLAAVTKQLSKLGDTVFELESISADIDEGLFVPAGKLNELRRELVERLTEGIAASYGKKAVSEDYIPEIPRKTLSRALEKLPLRTFCRTAEQAAAAAKLSEYLVIPEELITEKLLEIVPKEKIIASPPRFITDEEKTISRLAELKELGISRMLCHTLDGAAIGKKLGYELHGSFTMNLFNSLSAGYYKKAGFADCIVSPEMTAAQLENISTDLSLGAVIYGRLPLMLTRNCPIKNEVGCKNCTGYLTDRTSRKLPVACSREYTEILNSDVLYMGDRISELKNISFGVMLLNSENAAETRAALSLRRPEGSITKGLYYRGVCENT